MYREHKPVHKQVGVGLNMRSQTALVFRERLVSFTFLLPALIIFASMIVIPFFMGAVYAFTDWDGATKGFNYVGFQNFFDVVKEKRIADATRNTLLFTLYQTVSVNVVGLFIAVLIKKATTFNRFLRTVFFMPFMCSIVFAAFIWSKFYSDVWEGVFSIVNPLSDIGAVIGGIAVIALWRDAGYAMIVYIAALQAVPESLYEAGRVDGMNPIQSFFKITLPLIVPAITVNVTLYVGWGLRTFDYVMASTQGGPGSASDTIAILVWRYTFAWRQVGMGQAFALLMMFGVFLITQTITRVLRSREVEL